MGAKQNTYLAVDIGASSGRVIAGRFDGQRLVLEEAYRFPNAPVRVRGSYRWDIDGLFRQVLSGLGKASSEYGRQIVSLGIDTWGVDYGLLDEEDRLVDQPFAYRDGRVEGMQEEAFRRVSRERVYEVTGIQFLPFNTLFQLLAEVVEGREELKRARRLLFIPDLLNFWLTGRKASEYTVASTGQLLDARKRSWATGLIREMGLPGGLFGELVEAGEQMGPLRADLLAQTGLNGCKVVAPGSHDTASAVAAVPFARVGGAYLSSGTWSLIGVESSAPVITPLSAAHGFTNEGGVCGTLRVLKNISGLWIMQECRRMWAEQGEQHGFEELTKLAAEAEPFLARIDPDDAVFASPGDMPERIRAWCLRTGQPVPETKGQIVRVALESLALRYRAVLEMLEEVAETRFKILHIVGGGVKNRLLNQFTANALNRRVVAGPVEATSIGNLLMQLLAAGEISSLEEGRSLVRASFATEVFEPRDVDAWDDAYGATAPAGT